MKAISAELPDQLYHGIKLLVNRGWFKTEEEIMLEALRRFLDTHEAELIENFVREDVKWGLHGKE